MQILKQVYTFLVLMLFTASVIGVNFSLHYCVDHKRESISLFSKAECPCGNSHSQLACGANCASAEHSSCEHSTCSNSSHSHRSHCHNCNSHSDACGSAIDCCSEQDVEIQISDVFSASIYKYYDDTTAEHFVVDYQQVLLYDETNVCYQKEIVLLPEINERSIHPLTHVYSSYSDDEADSIS